MPKYTLLAPAYLNERLCAEGEMVETDLRPGPHMVPWIDDKGREDKAARKALDDAAKDARPMPGDPRYIGDMIQHTLEDGGTHGRIDTHSSIPRDGAMVPLVDADGLVRGVAPAPLVIPPPDQV